MQTPPRPSLKKPEDRTIAAKTPHQTNYLSQFTKTPFQTNFKSNFTKTPNQSNNELIPTKTPHQLNPVFQRGFRSEIQNRAPNRFCTENNFFRPNPQTSQRPRHGEVSSALSRLGNLLSKNTDIVQRARQQENKTPRSHSEPSIKYQVRVNDKTYKVLKKIGSGGSAKVYEGFEPTTYQSVAIKIINVAGADPKTQEGFFNERSLLLKLQDSKHVVRIFNSEYKTECKELVIVMEKGDADLAQVIESHYKTRGNKIDCIFIKFYWRGMLKAVEDIHRHGIVHADLKPVNFILVKNEIKLIDFGIASAIAPDGTSIIRDYQIGTINYMAPEALKKRAMSQNPNEKTIIKYNSKVDIWSLGCILYNLVYGKPPFDGLKEIIAKLQAITDPRYPIVFPEINNPHLMRIMKSCLRFNPIERPSARQLLEDPFLTEDLSELIKE